MSLVPIQKKIVVALLGECAARGLQATVVAPDHEFLVDDTVNLPSIAQAVEHAFKFDEAVIGFHELASDTNGLLDAWVHFIFYNDLEDMVSDYSVHPSLRGAVASIYKEWFDEVLA